MLGLPSTTETSVRIPKEAFYRNMDLNTKMREQFVSEVESITVVNSIKPSTLTVADGKRVHEILVLDVEPKGRGRVPDDVLVAIAKANQSRMLFAWQNSSRVALVHEGTYVSTSDEGNNDLVLHGHNLDEVWDSMVSQVMFDEVDGKDVDKRIERQREILFLDHEIDVLDCKVRKEKQPYRKNELYDQLRAKRKQLSSLKEEK